MLTRSETNDLDNALLKQCPGPAGCACRFCKARQVIAAYERVAKLLDERECDLRDGGATCRVTAPRYRCTTCKLRHAMEG